MKLIEDQLQQRPWLYAEWAYWGVECPWCESAAFTVYDATTTRVHCHGCGRTWDKLDIHWPYVMEVAA